jgi:hypothetical protein
MAPSHDVHDYSPDLVRLFSDWLHHLSCARWREIFRIHRLARGGLLSDPGLARSAGVCDAAVGHFDACSGFSSSMGPAQADRALDDPNLAVRVRHRSSRLFNALQMVPSTGPLASAALRDYQATHNFDTRRRQRALERRTDKSLRCQNLALNRDLMFDQSDEPPRTEETLW